MTGTLYGMKLIKMSYGGTGAAAGAVLWGQVIYDAVSLSNPQLGNGGITKDSNSNVYSCMVIGNTAGTVMQTLMMKFNANTGARVANTDMYTPNAIDCNVFFFSASTKVLLGIVYSTGTTEFINWDVSGINLAAGTSFPRLRFVTTGYKQLGLGRMFMSGSDVWLLFPSVGTSASALTSIFASKLADVTNMNWNADEGCASIHKQDVDLTVYASYKMGSPNYGGDNIDSATLMTLNAAASVINALPANYYVNFITPD